MVTSILGLFVFVALAWSLGRKRGALNLRMLFWGLGLQLLLGFLVFRTGLGQATLLKVNDLVNALIAASAAGPNFLFGSLADPAASAQSGVGFVLFFQGLLSIIVISALLQLLYHIGVMQWLVKALASVFSRLFGVSGVDALAASSNIFVGNEAIVTVRPFLAKMTSSELCVLMTACMATVSANMMGAYVAVLSGVFPSIAGHIASASVISAPAALLAAKLVWPETEQPETLGVRVEPYVEKSPNAILAVMSGATAGGQLLLGVGILLVAVVGLLGIVDALAGWTGDGVAGLTGWKCEWSVSWFLGLLFRPAAWLMGVPWAESEMVGELLGVRAVTTEMGAYPRLAEFMAGNALSPRSATIAAYALCGFAHIPAVAITAGGVSALEPSRKYQISVIAPRAFVAATLACLMTGCIAGIFAPDDPAFLFIPLAP